MKFSFSHGLRLSMLCVMLVLAGCAGKKQRVSYDRHAFDSAIKDAASEYGVDAKLITAMIQVESGFNPAAVSKSNAIGLMQLKADTAGCDAYRYKGKRGCPDADDLRDPDTNIDLGAAYLATLQNSSLKGSRTLLRCATPPSSPTSTAPARCCAPSPATASRPSR